MTDSGTIYQVQLAVYEGPLDLLLDLIERQELEITKVSLAQVTDSYLSQLDSLAGKKVALLVTEALPYPWMGGNRAVSRMKKLAASKGAEVLGFGIVNWSRRDRERRISRVVDDLAGLF